MYATLNKSSQLASHSTLRSWQFAGIKSNSTQRVYPSFNSTFPRIERNVTKILNRALATFLLPLPCFWRRSSLSSLSPSLMHFLKDKYKDKTIKMNKSKRSSRRRFLQKLPIKTFSTTLLKGKREIGNVCFSMGMWWSEIVIKLNWFISYYILRFLSLCGSGFVSWSLSFL